jgi:hypothetical protein
MKKIVLSALLMLSLCVGAYAGYPVSAYINSSSGAGLLDTSVYVSSGSFLSISNLTYDTWTLGSYTQECNADGTDPFNNNLGYYTANGQTFLLGAMVGKIGNSPYFLVGTSYNQIANTSGNLFLGCWDYDYLDNSGWITASVSSTYNLPIGAPLPASIPVMFLSGISSLGFLKRKKA